MRFRLTPVAPNAFPMCSRMTPVDQIALNIRLDHSRIIQTVFSMLRCALTRAALTVSIKTLSGEHFLSSDITLVMRPSAWRPFPGAQFTMASQKILKRPASPPEASQSATSAGISQHTSRKRAGVSNRQSSEASTSPFEKSFLRRSGLREVRGGESGSSRTHKEIASHHSPFARGSAPSKNEIEPSYESAGCRVGFWEGYRGFRQGTWNVGALRVTLPVTRLTVHRWLQVILKDVYKSDSDLARCDQARGG